MVFSAAMRYTHGIPLREYMLKGRRQPNQEQLRSYTQENLRPSSIDFSLRKLQSSLNSQVGQRFVGVDIGGGKMEFAEFEVVKGRNGAELSIIGNPSKFERNHGEGYAQKLTEIAERGLPIGISWAGPIKNGEPLDAPNMEMLFSELREKYDGKLSELIPGVAAINDAPAALIAEVVQVASQFPTAKNIVLGINGGGTGGCVATKTADNDWKLTAIEPGHIPVVDELNPFKVKDECKLLVDPKAHGPCIEMVAGGEAGIAKQWNDMESSHMQNATKRTGKEVIELAESHGLRRGSPFARAIVENSQKAMAHVYKGIMDAFGFGPRDTIVVEHGGTFKSAYYRKGVEKRLQSYTGFKPNVINTSESNINPGIVGAAYAAILKASKV